MMRLRLFLTFVSTLLISIAMYMVGEWSGQVTPIGVSVPSRMFIPIFAAVILASMSWAIWNLEVQRTAQSIARSQKTADTRKRGKTSLEKQKRDRLDSVLRDLSDEDLIRLRQRLNDGSVDDELLYEHIVGDDGELMRIER